MIKLIWRKAASPPHTDGSIVFKWRQCAPLSVHHALYRFCPCWVALSISTARRVLSPSILSVQMWGYHLIHGSLGPPESTSRTALRPPLLQGSWSWQIESRYSPTDAQHYSVSRNRPYPVNMTAGAIKLSLSRYSLHGLRTYCMIVKMKTDRPAVGHFSIISIFRSFNFSISWFLVKKNKQTRMWADAQRDGGPAKLRGTLCWMLIQIQIFIDSFAV